MASPIALSYEGRVALATFVCVIVWWMTQPMPWAVAAMLPFLVFPAAGVMDIADDDAALRPADLLLDHGHRADGLRDREARPRAAVRARRFSRCAGIGGQTHRLTFTYMLIVGVISMFVSDAATVAMTIPIGMSIVRHIARTMAGARRRGRETNFAAFITLGTFYASVAGGTATIMGVPHNAIAVALLEQFTGRQLGFFEWMLVGVPVFVALLVAFYAILWVLVRAGDPRHPERRGVPARRARQARADAAQRAAGAARVRDDGAAVHAADAAGARARRPAPGARRGRRARSRSGWCRRR